MARSLRSIWCTQTNIGTHYEDTKTHIIRRRADSSGKGISFRIVPSFSYAMQIHSNEGGQHPGEGKDLKKEQLQELVKLWEQGYINLRFGDESHVCTSGYVPYGWHLADGELSVPSGEKHRLNIFGMISPDCRYDGFDPERLHYGRSPGRLP